MITITTNTIRFNISSPSFLQILLKRQVSYVGTSSSVTIENTANHTEYRNSRSASVDIELNLMITIFPANSGE